MTLTLAKPTESPRSIEATVDHARHDLEAYKARKRALRGFWRQKEEWLQSILPDAIPCDECGGEGRREYPHPSGDPQLAYDAGCHVCHGTGVMQP